MTSNIDYVKEHVNLRGYSSSPYFQGFSISEGGWGKEFLFQGWTDIVTELVDKIHLISSPEIMQTLQENAESYELTEPEIAYRDALIKQGIIMQVGPTESYEDEDDHAPCFHFDQEVDRDIVMETIRYQTSVGGAYGHLFFVDLHQGIIIYPHDDPGLGFILGSEAEKQQRNKSLLKEIVQRYQFSMTFNFEK